MEKRSGKHLRCKAMVSMVGWVVVLCMALDGLPGEPHALMEGAGSWQTLFNGKDLTGWTVDGADVWRVEKDTLVGRGTGEGSILWSQESFKHYELSLSYKMEGDHPDSGVFITNTDYQVQMGISGSLKRDMSGCIYYGGKGEGRGTYIGRFPDPEKAIHQGKWNDLNIRVTANRVRVKLNGKQVLDFIENEPTRSFPGTGRLGLQVHGNNVMTVYFRNVQLRQIEP